MYSSPMPSVRPSGGERRMERSTKFIRWIFSPGHAGPRRLDPRHVEDIICGCVTATGEQGTNIGRLAGLKAKFPIETPASN